MALFFLFVGVFVLVALDTIVFIAFFFLLHQNIMYYFGDANAEELDAKILEEREEHLLPWEYKGVRQSSRGIDELI